MAATDLERYGRAWRDYRWRVAMFLAASLGGLAWASPASAQGLERPLGQARLYVGIDALWGSIASQHPSIDGSSGAGLELMFGWRLADGIAWDTRFGGFWTEVGPAPEISYPADKADYGFFMTGIVWEVLGSDAPATPWLGLWGGIHVVQWDTFVYSVAGLGGSLGAGVQLRLPLGFLRLGALASLVAASSSYDAPAGGTTVVLVTGGWCYDWGG